MQLAPLMRAIKDKIESTSSAVSASASDSRSWPR